MGLRPRSWASRVLRSGERKTPNACKKAGDGFSHPSGRSGAHPYRLRRRLERAVRGREEGGACLCARGFGRAVEWNLPADTSQRGHAAERQRGRDEPRQRRVMDGDVATQRRHRHAGLHRRGRRGGNEVAVVARSQREAGDHWWRGVKGKLAITGPRLDAKAPPLTADVPDGYGRRGFQPSGISFPTDGCWEVTGAVGEVKLTFVTLILKASRYRSMAEGR